MQIGVLEGEFVDRVFAVSKVMRGTYQLLKFVLGELIAHLEPIEVINFVDQHLDEFGALFRNILLLFGRRNCTQRIYCFTFLQEGHVSDVVGQE